MSETTNNIEGCRMGYKERRPKKPKKKKGICDNMTGGQRHLVGLPIELFGQEY
jgi:hypothetical protein